MQNFMKNIIRKYFSRNLVFTKKNLSLKALKIKFRIDLNSRIKFSIDSTFASTHKQ